MKVLIGNVEYKSISECTKKVREWLTEIYEFNKESIIIKSNPNFNFLMDVLNKHPRSNNKIGLGVEFFTLQLNPINKKGVEVIIHRVDGTKEDFSWLVAIGAKKNTSRTKRIAAMRHAVKRITIEYKQNNDLICNHCGITSDNLEYHKFATDHKTIPFSVIAEEFLLNNDASAPKIFDNDPISHCPIFQLKDKYFEEKWYNYHLEHSDFQILCASCNSKKGTKIT